MYGSNPPFTPEMTANAWRALARDRWALVFYTACLVAAGFASGCAVAVLVYLAVVLWR